ncbi:MAG: RNA polymerase sigma factor [Cyclobacteriaceae bacterium]|nr:RNA polymerase sigma factor [Cyclobacteriaceae bacterium]
MTEINPSDVCKESVFQEIFRKNAQDLHDFLYYKFGSENYPGDLVQEAFIKLWNNCSKVPPQKARSFLFTVARNQMLNELDKKKTVLKYQKQLSIDRDLETPQFKLEEREYMERLQRSIEELSEEQRVAFLLNRIEGKKHQEIADILGISRKAVEKRIYTALSKLRGKLEKL